jgi:hypothetical protein
MRLLRLIGRHAGALYLLALLSEALVLGGLLSQLWH